VQGANRQNKQSKCKIKLQYPRQHVVTVLLTFSSGGEEDDEERWTDNQAAPVALLSRQTAVSCWFRVVNRTRTGIHISFPLNELHERNPCQETNGWSTRHEIFLILQHSKVYNCVYKSPHSSLSCARHIQSQLFLLLHYHPLSCLVLPAHYIYDYGNIIHRSVDCIIRARDRLDKGTACLSEAYRVSRQKEAKLNLANVRHLKPW
jgi:hypothetical protein